MNLTTARRRLLEWYAQRGRKGLPWRVTRDPYFTLVSEFMLQQTQVDRVIPKFEAFVAQFPDVRTLAAASKADVLRAWRGLGYNSRAVRLQQVAEAIVARHGGVVPRDRDALTALPGIGAYTAAAIRSFAFGLRDAAVDTNVRRIAHRFFAGLEYPPKATAREVDAWAARLVPARDAHDWNSAMMDLGAELCTARRPKCLLCPLRAQCAAAPIDAAALDAARQAYVARRKRAPATPFAATTRFARGRIVDRLRELPPGQAISLLDLHGCLQGVLIDRSVDDLRALVGALERDGLVVRAGERIALRE